MEQSTQNSSVEAQYEQDWQKFQTDFNEKYKEAELIASIFNQLNQDGELNSIVPKNAWEKKPVARIPVPHPMLYPKAVQYAQLFCLEQIKITLENLNLVKGKRKKLNPKIQLFGDELAKELINHELSHYGAGLTYLSPEQTTLFITLGLYLVDIEGTSSFYINVMGGQNFIEDYPAEYAEQKIHQYLAPEKPSTFDFEAAIEIARSNGLDISELLKEKGYSKSNEDKSKKQIR